jgi:hypothetical protein
MLKWHWLHQCPQSHSYVKVTLHTPFVDHNKQSKKLSTSKSSYIWYCTYSSILKVTMTWQFFTSSHIISPNIH